jgi:hypothetical protein
VVINNDDFASVRSASVASQKPAVLVSHTVNARAVWSVEYRNVLVTAALYMHAARLPAEAIVVIVANYGVPTLANDDASRFLDHDPAVLAHLMAGAAQVLKVACVVVWWWRYKGLARNCRW